MAGFADMKSRSKISKCMNPEIVFLISVGGRLMMIAALIGIGVYFLRKLSTISDDE